jgi:hypothetical protein
VTVSLFDTPGSMKANRSRQLRASSAVLAPVEKRRKQEIGWALHNMDYRALADRIVPYRSFTLDTKTPVIREVVLGPRNISPILIVQVALRRHGWINVRVRKSSASYR